MNRIILSNDFAKTKAEILTTYKNTRVFENSEILLEDAHAAVKEAYIAESSLKSIVLIGHKFRVEAQNALLLVLEDSPKNIEFILVSGSKTVFLPTIRSRLAIISELKSREISRVDLNFAKLGLEHIDTFLSQKIELEKKGELDKEELLNLIHAIVKQSVENGVKFSMSELEYINKLFVLVSLNTKVKGVLTPLLLLIGGKR